MKKQMIFFDIDVTLMNDEQVSSFYVKKLWGDLGIHSFVSFNGQ
jgi:hypothetical protein